METIAVVEDNVLTGDLISEILTEAGFRVIRAYSGTEALLLLKAEKADLILLDLMLPGLSGEELLPELTGTPVIVLSAKSDVQGKVQLLLGGAADYITKPFDAGELLARVAVQLRRSACGQSARLSYGNMELDLSSHQLTVGAVPVKLTRTEFAIMKLLMQSPAQVIAKSVILDGISLDTPDCTESSLKIHVSNLRKKLRDVDGQEHIEAVWGIGFRLI